MKEDDIALQFQKTLDKLNVVDKHFIFSVIFEDLIKFRNLGVKEVIDWFKEQGYGNMNHSGFNIICSDAEKKFLTNHG